MSDQLSPEELQALAELSAKFADDIEQTPREAAEALREELARVLATDGIPIDLVPLEVLEFREILGRESDRGCALLARATLEAATIALLTAHFVDDSRLVKKMLTGIGPLATFSSRIELSYLLGLIGPMVHRDLHIIRDIGNRFAHGPMDISFESERVRELCKRLHHDFLDEPLPPRKKFTRVTMGVLACVHGRTLKTSHCPKAADVDLTKARTTVAFLTHKVSDSGEVAG